MKTRSLFGIFPLILSAMMTGGTNMPLGNNYELELHSHGTYHKRGKFKGYMRENRRTGRGHGYNKKRIAA